MTWIGTSWKMTKTLSEAVDYAGRLDSVEDWPTGIRPFVLPPLTALAAVRARLDFASPVTVGAQNAHWAPDGAYTGEVSMAMIADAGATIVEIGHSERRRLFGETDDVVALKAAAALDAGLTALLCVGEFAEERAAGAAIDRVLAQIESALPVDHAGRVLIAYEPVWAIGADGRAAGPEDVAEIFAAIAAEYGAEMRDGWIAGLLYGGSVNAENAAALLRVSGVDGLFIGRAAWDVDGFLSLVRIAGSTRTTSG